MNHQKIIASLTEILRRFPESGLLVADILQQINLPLDQLAGKSAPPTYDVRLGSNPRLIEVREKQQITASKKRYDQLARRLDGKKTITYQQLVKGFEFPELENRAITRFWKRCGLLSQTHVMDVADNFVAKAEEAWEALRFGGLPPTVVNAEV